MKKFFNGARSPELQLIGIMTTCTPSRAVDPWVCAGFILPENSPVTPETSPDVELNFKGFDVLESDSDVLDALSLAEQRPVQFAMRGAGYVSCGQNMLLETGDGDKSTTEVAEFISRVIQVTFRYQKTVIVQVIRETTMSASNFMFSASVEIPEETWHQLFAVKSQELTAATMHWQSLGNAMAIEANPSLKDIAGNRTLN